MNQQDRAIIRDLAKRVAEIAELPIQAEKREMWKRHHALERVRPIILVAPEGSWFEIVPQSALQCEDTWARGIEENLRRRIFQHEHIGDDTVIERTWAVNKTVSNTGWGLDWEWTWSQAAGGAGTYKPVIESADDLKKLRFPEVVHDEEADARNLEAAQELLGDILDVQLKGVRTISFHLMNLYTHLRGLDQVMIDMYTEPGMLHDAMSFLEQGHHKLIDQYVQMNLLDLNNDESYVYPASNGYSDELPPAGYDPNHITPKDMWASAEAQELTLVSPEMTWEFALQYEKRLVERFGLAVYGCCEDLTKKLDYVFRIENLRQVNIAPAANVEKCAEQFAGKDLIFSWKPQPSHLVGDFDEDFIRGYLKHGVEVSRGLVFEMVLKDTHTCENHPERFTRWVEIAKEVCEGS